MIFLNQDIDLNFIKIFNKSSFLFFAARTTCRTFVSSMTNKGAASKEKMKIIDRNIRLFMRLYTGNRGAANERRSFFVPIRTVASKYQAICIKRRSS